MKPRSVTIGLPVADLNKGVTWYQSAFELSDPDLRPADGIVEFKLGPIWLQLSEGTTDCAGAEIVTRFGVDDVAAQHARLLALGFPVGPLQHVEGVIDYFDFSDQDGNQLSMYTEVT